jgi:hypothetical protein
MIQTTSPRLHRLSHQRVYGFWNLDMADLLLDEVLPHAPPYLSERHLKLPANMGWLVA